MIALKEAPPCWTFRNSTLEPSDVDYFADDTTNDLSESLERRGFSVTPLIRLGSESDPLSVEIYGHQLVSNQKTPQYAAVLTVGYVAEIIELPMLPDLLRFLERFSPLIASLAAHQARLEQEEERDRVAMMRRRSVNR